MNYLLSVTYFIWLSQQIQTTSLYGINRLFFLIGRDCVRYKMKGNYSENNLVLWASILCRLHDYIAHVTLSLRGDNFSYFVKHTVTLLWNTNPSGICSLTNREHLFVT